MLYIAKLTPVAHIHMTVVGPNHKREKDVIQNMGDNQTLEERQAN
jgi:hypothetical protein